MSEIVSDKDLDYGGKGEVPTPVYMMNNLFEKEIKIYTKRMLGVIQDVSSRKDTRNNMLGDLGEMFVDNLQVVFSKRFYLYGNEYKGSYSVITHYKSPKYSPRGGIDKYISVIDEAGDVYNLAIEVKNWLGMKSISDEMFEKDILDRFSVCSESDYKILAITRKNIPIINDRCVENDIILLPIENHITPEIDREGMEYSLHFFYKEFDNLLQKIIYNDRNGYIRKSHKYGLSVKDLAEITGLSERHIRRVLDR